METTLDTKQSARLIELGVDPKLASEHTDRAKWSGKENEPIFTLADLLGIIPKWIKYRNMLLWLCIRIDQYEERWCCAYQGGPYDCDDADTFQSAEELIDALYELLVYCIEEKLITFK